MPLDFSTGRAPISAFSLASLTDIVLLLLIFFLLTSSFVTQYALQVNLPSVTTTRPVEQQYVAVTIQPDGRFFVDDRETAADDLEAALAAARGAKTGVAVYADEEATVGQLATVASAASALDLRVSIATEMEE